MRRNKVRRKKIQWGHDTILLIFITYIFRLNYPTESDQHLSNHKSINFLHIYKTLKKMVKPASPQKEVRYFLRIKKNQQLLQVH